MGARGAVAFCGVRRMYAGAMAVNFGNSEQIQTVTTRMMLEAQDRMNREWAAWQKFRDYYGWPEPKPLTRWQKIKRRVSNRWFSVRRCVAVAICPELDEDY